MGEINRFSYNARMLNFALIGCGGIAHWHAQQLQKIDDCRVVALCDNVSSQTKTFKEKYFPEAKEFESYKEMLVQTAGDLDAVVLVTPHTLHYSQAKAALLAGLHVLTEKPMVTNVDHAYDLWRITKSTKKLLGITFQSPYTDTFAYLAQERDAKRLGNIQLISGQLSQGWLENTRGKWRQDPSLSGGGQMYDSGAHLLNAIMWLLNNPATEVACFYDKCDSPVDINGVAIARFQSGAYASIAIGGNCPQFATEIQIQTDRFRIVTDQYGGKLEMFGKDNKRIYPHVKQDDRPSAGTPHLNFVNAILGGEKLRAPVRYGVLLSALMDAMYQSADTRQIVQVQPVPDELS